jgi:hypothetical protein
MTIQIGLLLYVPNWAMERAYRKDFLTAYTKSLYKVCESGATSANVHFDLEEHS